MAYEFVTPEPCRRCGVGSVPGLARIILLVMMVSIADAQGNYFTVSSGSCTVDPSSPNCIRSPNFPSNYGDNQACAITPTALAIGRPLTATSFSTEYFWDYLRIPSHPSGTLTNFNSGLGGGPSNFILGPGAIQWSSDSSVVSSGWRVCSLPPSPPPPPSASRSLQWQYNMPPSPSLPPEYDWFSGPTTPKTQLAVAWVV